MNSVSQYLPPGHPRYNTNIRGSTSSLPADREVISVDNRKLTRKSMGRFNAAKESEDDKRFADLRVKGGEKKSPRRYD